ncbi:MAG: hypothetical protein ACHBNF_11015 [Chromatiales bacterium]
MDVDDSRCIFATIGGVITGFFFGIEVYDSLSFALIIGQFGFGIIGAWGGGAGAISVACHPPHK